MNVTGGSWQVFQFSDVLALSRRIFAQLIFVHEFN